MRALLLIAASITLAACADSSDSHGLRGPTGPTGPTGPAGMDGAQGDKGDPGPVTVLDGGTIQGPTGPAGESVTITPLPMGDATCPQGGVQLGVGTSVTVVCNGATGSPGAAGPQGPVGPQGPAGATGATGAMGEAGAAGPAGPAGPIGPQGPAGASVTLTSLANGDTACPYGGTQLTVGATISYVCNGGPGNGAGGSVTYDGGVPPVTFAGYTPQTYGGNLGGRSGAHAICDAAFPGSHFCTDWEVDQSYPPPVGSSAWVDVGDPDSSTRYFRDSYSTTDTGTCAGWTSSSATVKPDGVNWGRGWTYTSLGGFKSSFVGTNDTGCQTPRPLACCRGGTGVRFRGFTPSSMGGNLGGRSGATAICNAAFSGSHFCTDWEVDQAAVPAPIPASGAWVDVGNGAQSTRFHHATYSTTDTGTCAGWTSSSATVKPDGVNWGRGWMLTPLGGFKSSFVGTNDTGCQTPRPLACCDGYPPN